MSTKLLALSKSNRDRGQIQNKVVAQTSILCAGTMPLQRLDIRQIETEYKGVNIVRHAQSNIQLVDMKPSVRNPTVFILLDVACSSLTVLG